MFSWFGQDTLADDILSVSKIEQLIANHDYRTALKACEARIHDGGGSKKQFEDYRLRGTIHLQLNNLDKALMDFRQALSVHGLEDTSTYIKDRQRDIQGTDNSLLLHCAIESKLSEDIAVSNAAQIYSPQDYGMARKIIKVMIQIGDIYQKQGHTFASLKRFNLALTLIGEHHVLFDLKAQVLMHRGALHITNNQPTIGFKDYEIALMLAPDKALPELKPYIHNLWFHAIEIGNRDLINALKDKLEVTVQNEAGQTGLHLAVLHQQVKLIAVVIQAGIGVDKLNQAGETALLVSAKIGDISCFDALLERGAQPLLKCNNITLLEAALRAGQAQMIKRLTHLAVWDTLLMQSGGLPIVLPQIVELHQASVLRHVLKLHPEYIKNKKQSQTILSHATARGTVNEVGALLTSGMPLYLFLDRQDQIMHGEQYSQAMKTLVLNISTFYQTICIQLRQNGWPLDQKDNETILAACLSDMLSRYPESYRLFFDKQHDITILTKSVINALTAHQSTIIKKTRMLKDKSLDEPVLSSILLPIIEKAVSLLANDSPMPDEKITEQPISAITMWQVNTKQARTSFCDRFERQFDKAYGYFMAIAEEKAERAPDATDKAMAAAKLASPLLPSVHIPGVPVEVPTSMAVNALITIGQYIRNNYKHKEAMRFMTLFDGVKPSERTEFIRYTASQLADKFPQQMNYLALNSNGVELLADSATACIIDYIINKDRNILETQESLMGSLARKLSSFVLGTYTPPEETQYKTLYEIFIMGIITTDSKAGIEKKRLDTRGNTLSDNWQSMGIFRNTGIITPDGRRWAHKNSKLNKYGYVAGTETEARKRGLSEGPNKNESWGLGRQWNSEVTSESQLAEQHRRRKFRR